MPSYQNLDSSPKPPRLKICFDARALMYISRSSANRSGITLSAYQVLLALSKICEVRLFCELEFYTLCKRECAKLESLQGFSFVNRFSLVERALSYLCYQKYSICHYLRERNHPILDRAMRAVFLPFIILSRYHKLGSSTLESMQSCDILFSPYYAFAKEIAALDSVRFTLLHDVIPIVYEEHFRMSDIPIDKLLRQVLRQVLRQRHDFYDIADSLNVKDFYITNSAFTKADFLKHFPTRLCESHISVALLGADREIFYRDFDERKNAQIRERYHIPHNARYIFSLCSLDPRKNLIFVARNFIECIKKHNINDLVLVLGGGAWDGFINELESSFDSLGELRGKIIRAGYVEDRHLANLFSHSLASVYLSTYEGFGLPVLESMSCGCPTIASSTTSVPEVLGSGGIALDPNDALGLQEAIYKIYSDESYAKKLSQRALEQAGRFSWEGCAGEIYNAFSHALLSVDSAFSEKCGSLRLASSIDLQVLSPCSPLRNPHFSSKILESQSSSENHKSHREQTSLESTFAQSFHSPTAIPRILEEEKSSSRADKVGVAIHSLESSFAKVDSRARAVDSMDCHADFQSARNDKNNAICKKVDSRINAQNVSEPAKDSRIFDNKAQKVSESQAEAVEMRNRGFQGAGEGIYLGDNEHARAVESTIYRSNATPPSPKPTPKTKEAQSLKHLHRIFFACLCHNAQHCRIAHPRLNRLKSRGQQDF